jgi:hypothetical protein
MWSLMWLLLVVCSQYGVFGTRIPTTMLEAGSSVLSSGEGFFCQLGACKRWFAKSRGLGRHYQTSGHGGPSHPIRVRCRRHSYSFTRKRDLILELDGLRYAGVTDPAKTLSRRTGIHDSDLCKWNKNRNEIFLRARTRGMAKLRKYRPSIGTHPEAELELYGRFVWRRKYQRLATHRDWLRDNMAEILRRDYNITKVRSAGWCSNFCRRWAITSQCRTNKHKQSVQERLPAIRKFHTWLIYGLQRSEPQRCPKYGRFPPHLMYHMDQVPLPFSSGSKKTLNMTGEHCAIRDPVGSGGDKRFCTLQVTICAQGDQQRVKLEIIFRGQGLTLSAEERACYAGLDNVNIRWQKKAWADEKITMEYLLAFREATLDQGEVLLGMDNHGAQMTPACRAFFELMGIQPVFTPANCTDCTSPVDHHVGQALKLKIGARYQKALEADRDAWEKDAADGGLSASRKRMLVATWASEAWAELCKDNQGLLRQAFVTTGFLVAMDGSENGLIVLEPAHAGAAAVPYSF